MIPSLVTLTSHQRLQVALAADVHPRTVLRCYRALPVRERIAERIARAARELRLPEPRSVIARSVR